MFDGASYAATAAVWGALGKTRTATLRTLISTSLLRRPVAALRGAAIGRSPPLLPLILSCLLRRPATRLPPIYWCLLRWSATRLPRISPLLFLPPIAAFLASPAILRLIFIPLGNFLDRKIAGCCHDRYRRKDNYGAYGI